MTKIQINFDTVPDEMKPVDPGTYTCVVKEAILADAKSGGQKIVVTLAIDDEGGKNHNRQLFDHISIKMETNLKRLAKSAGLNPGSDGFDLEDLVGKHVRVLVKNSTYKDEATGEVRETSRVAQYLF